MAHPGILHHYFPPRLSAFEHIPSSPSPTPTHDARPQNLILFIGGLSDGLLTVTYPSLIAASLPPTWRLAEVLLSSSYEGWRTGSLARDARELGEAVKYFRKRMREQGNGIGEGEGKIVLMGHSTGCQDIMEYLVGPLNAAAAAKHADEHHDDNEKETTTPHVDAVILQGGVSDREAHFSALLSSPSVGGDPVLAQRKYDDLVSKAQAMTSDGRGNECMSREGHFILADEDENQITAYRTYSLLQPGGDDDYFSSDLSDEVLGLTFGALPRRAGRVMFLLGSRDPYVPSWVDREGLLRRWTEVVRGAGGDVDTVNGGVVPGAAHNLNDDEEVVRRDLVQRVVRFVEGLGESSE
ncbi:DUF1749-domain-containing protein [Westerdykella ornata]|uniref:DUF1749-domain-containing protein n=1 Tax=Westerdykella ornata TaxID=318751 RepID=A0A6A6JSD8_WESOR|nr:DUF1749-domain-containing protein [Westerdykella ornata]KAF2278646.1 DUF1749-domain-containing protein [Westerdykella ornata]